MKKILLLISIVITVHFVSFGQQSPGDQGFRIKEIRFDESVQTNKPLPKIPASWRFIGVSNFKSNGSNLWFQDKDGSIYLVSGFTDSTGEFVAKETIQKFNADTNSLPK